MRGACLVLLAACAPPQEGRVSDGSAFGDYLAGRVASLRGEPERAAVFLSRFDASASGENTILTERLRLEIAAGQMRRALAIARRLKGDTNPRGGFAEIVLGLEVLKKGYAARARALFETAAQKNADWPGSDILLAWARLGAGAAPVTIADGIEFSEQEFEMNLLRVFTRALLYDLGDDARTKQTYAEAMHPANIIGLSRVIEAYGRFLERAGDEKGAREIYDAITQGDGWRAVPGTSGHARLERGTRPERLVASARAGVAEAFYFWSRAAFAHNDRDSALVYMRLALYVRPDFIPARMALAEILKYREDFAQAIALYHSIPQQSAYYLDAQIQTAMAHDNLDRPDEARRLLRVLALARPDNPTPLVALGDLNRMHSKFEDAADNYTEALARMTDNDEPDWVVLYARGIAYERTGLWDKAERDLKHALKLSQNHPLVLNYLGYSWVEQKRYLTEALDMLERAVKARPNDGHITDSLGWAHYRLGTYDKAIAYLERAADLEPGEAVINDHLGDALWQVGRTIEARFQWRRALELEPEDDMRASLEHKLVYGLDSTIETEAQGAPRP